MLLHDKTEIAMMGEVTEIRLVPYMSGSPLSRWCATVTAGNSEPCEVCVETQRNTPPEAGQFLSAFLHRAARAYALTQPRK